MTASIHQKELCIKPKNRPRNPNYSGAQSRLARILGISLNTMCCMTSGRGSAGPERARAIGAILGCDPLDWLKGGDIPSRRAAVEAWAALEKVNV